MPDDLNGRKKCKHCNTYFSPATLKNHLKRCKGNRPATPPDKEINEEDLHNENPEEFPALVPLAHKEEAKQASTAIKYLELEKVFTDHDITDIDPFKIPEDSSESSRTKIGETSRNIIEVPGEAETSKKVAFSEKPSITSEEGHMLNSEVGELSGSYEKGDVMRPGELSGYEAKLKSTVQYNSEVEVAKIPLPILQTPFQTQRLQFHVLGIKRCLLN